MTESDVCLDTWAWWEILGGTPTGRKLHKKYVQRENLRVHTSSLVLGEMLAKLLRLGQPKRFEHVHSVIRASSRIHEVTEALAIEGARIRHRLRERVSHAGLVDAIVLATAQSVGATLISGDSAFAEEAGVRSD